MDTEVNYSSLPSHWAPEESEVGTSTVTFFGKVGVGCESWVGFSVWLEMPTCLRPAKAGSFTYLLI